MIRWQFASFILLAGLGLLPFSFVAPPLVSICAIQGEDDVSQFAGDFVRVRGVVFGDLDNTSRKGFFMQEARCDKSPATSDGIWVYLGLAADVVDLGDEVEVNGQVLEYYGQTEVNATNGSVMRLSAGNPLPPAQEAAPPFEAAAAREYWEAREGMRLSLGTGQVVGPTESSGRSWLVASNLGIQRVFEEDTRGTGEVICVGDEGRYYIDPPVQVSQQVSGIVGGVDYSDGDYCLQLFQACQVSQGPGASDPALLPGSNDSPFHFSLATFNLAELFDTFDDPMTNDSVLSASEYQRRLQKRALAIRDGLQFPDLLVVQEVETLAVLQDLLQQPAMSQAYAIVWADSPDPRGLDTALLYRPDRISLISFTFYESCTGLVDGLGPDGNGDPQHPVNTLTCDRNGDGILDGNRLFSRPPLVAHVQVAGDLEPDGFWIIGNHWKSRLEDTHSILYTQPRRQEQAGFVAGIADDLRQSQPGARLLITGDFNDSPESSSLQILQAHNLRPLLPSVPRVDRYTYIFQGVSQVLDQGFSDLPLELQPVKIQPVHINADFPVIFSGVSGSLYRSSDHDPVRFDFQRVSDYQYLPFLAR